MQQQQQQQPNGNGHGYGHTHGGDSRKRAVGSVPRFSASAAAATAATAAAAVPVPALAAMARDDATGVRVFPRITPRNSALYNHLVYGLRRRHGSYAPLVHWVQTIDACCDHLVAVLRHIEEHDLLLRVLFGGLLSRNCDLAAAAATAVGKFCRLVDRAITTTTTTTDGSTGPGGGTTTGATSNDAVVVGSGGGLAASLVPPLSPVTRKAAIASSNRRRHRSGGVAANGGGGGGSSSDSGNGGGGDDHRGDATPPFSLRTSAMHRWWLLVGGRWEELRARGSKGSFPAGAAAASPLILRDNAASASSGAGAQSYKQQAEVAKAIAWLADNDKPFGLAAVVSLLCAFTTGTLNRGTAVTLVTSFITRRDQVVAVVEDVVPELVRDDDLLQLEEAEEDEEEEEHGEGEGEGPTGGTGGRGIGGRGRSRGGHGRRGGGAGAAAGMYRLPTGGSAACRELSCQLYLLRVLSGVPALHSPQLVGRMVARAVAMASSAGLGLGLGLGRGATTAGSGGGNYSGSNNYGSSNNSGVFGGRTSGVNSNALPVAAFGGAGGAGGAGAGAGEALVEEQCLALRFLAALWAEFPQLIGGIQDCVQSVVGAFKAQLRSSSEVVQTVAFTLLFDLIDGCVVGPAMAMCVLFFSFPAFRFAFV
jgi:hypothetical protein